MEITSGLRRMCLETTVMWENNTVLPERWLVSHSDYLSIHMQLFRFRKACEGKASYSH